MRRLAHLVACPACIVLGMTLASMMPEPCPGIARALCVLAFGVVGVVAAKALNPT